MRLFTGYFRSILSVFVAGGGGGGGGGEKHRIGAGTRSNLKISRFSFSMWRTSQRVQDFNEDTVNSAEPEEFTIMGINSAVKYQCCPNTSKPIY